MQRLFIELTWKYFWLAKLQKSKTDIRNNNPLYNCLRIVFDSDIETWENHPICIEPVWRFKEYHFCWCLSLTSAFITTLPIFNAFPTGSIKSCTEVRKNNLFCPRLFLVSILSVLIFLFECTFFLFPSSMQPNMRLSQKLSRDKQYYSFLK